MAKKIVSALSLNMADLASQPNGSFNWSVLTVQGAATLAQSGEWTKEVGHEDIARIAAGELGVEALFARTDIKVGAGDMLLVVQYTGSRLPAGTSVLPTGAKIQYVLVTVK